MRKSVHRGMPSPQLRITISKKIKLRYDTAPFFVGELPASDLTYGDVTQVMPSSSMSAW